MMSLKITFFSHLCISGRNCLQNYMQLTKSLCLLIRYVFLDLLGPWSDSVIWHPLRLALCVATSFLQIHSKRPMIQKTFLGPCLAGGEGTSRG